MIQPRFDGDARLMLHAIILDGLCLLSGFVLKIYDCCCINGSTFSDVTLLMQSGFGMSSASIVVAILLLIMGKRA